MTVPIKKVRTFFFLKGVWGIKVINVIFEAFFHVLSFVILLQNRHFDPLKVRIWPRAIKEKGQESKKLTFRPIPSLLTGLEVDSIRPVLNRNPWTKPFENSNFFGSKIDEKFKISIFELQKRYIPQKKAKIM